MSNEPSGLGAMFGNMVFGPSSNNKKRPAPDDVSDVSGGLSIEELY